MPLKAGTKAPLVVDGLEVDRYTHSMAAAMEKAFIEQWPHIMKDARLPESNDQMRLMFIAIAQGVVNHLKENSASLKVDVNINSGGLNYNASGTVNNIEIV